MGPTSLMSASSKYLVGGKLGKGCFPTSKPQLLWRLSSFLEVFFLLAKLILATTMAKGQSPQGFLLCVQGAGNVSVRNTCTGPLEFLFTFFSHSSPGLLHQRKLQVGHLNSLSGSTRLAASTLLGEAGGQQDSGWRRHPSPRRHGCMSCHCSMALLGNSSSAA